MFDHRELTDRRERIYRELGVPPPEKEDALERWQRLQPKPEPEPRESKLDPAPTLAEIDQRIEQRIAAEHERMFAILAEVIAHLQDEMAAAPPGPSGPPGPPGPEGAAGKMPIVTTWTPETVFYEGDAAQPHIKTRQLSAAR